MARYVGGRIVPTHGGVWNQAKEYETLTIVLEESSGDSYISKRPVPAGKAITEEHYWSLYSKYNAQITRAEQHLDSTVSAIRSEMNTQKQQVTQRMEQAEENVDQRASAAENLSNQNRSVLESRMELIEARQEANVHASTDADANYAAEVVDARVGADGTTYASLGASVRAIGNRLSADIDQVQSALNWYPELEFGAINIISGLETNAHSRLKSKFIRTDRVSNVVVCDGCNVIVCYYDQERTYVTAKGWYTPGEDIVLDSTYPFVKLLIKHFEDEGESIEFADVKNIWSYVYNASTSLYVYARNQAADATDNRIRHLFDRLISKTTYDVSDADDRALSNTARWFIPTPLPEKTYVDYVTIMLYRLSSTGVVEVWERSQDKEAYSLIKTIAFSATSIKNLDIPVDCYVAGGGYVSIRTDENSVIGLDDDDSYVIPYSKDLESETLYAAALSHISGKFNAKLTAYQYQFAVEEEDPVGLVFTIGEHDNVAEIITEAMKTRESIVYIEPYTHDCIAEWESFFGNGYWENLSRGRGIELCNDIHIIGRSGCLLTCHYRGNNDYVQSDFSLFNNPAGGSGYTIENVAFEVSKIRYVIHDERGGDATPYKVRYSRCRMSQDNSQSTWDHSRACIGGGLGLHGDVLVEDCIFGTVTSQANMDSLAYHNSGAAGAQNSLVIRGCFCEGDSTLQIASYGASTLQSKVLISNNSFGSPIEELHWDGNPGNFDIFYVNNETRSE